MKNEFQTKKKNGIRKGVGTGVPLNRALYKGPAYKGPLGYISNLSFCT